MSVKCAACQGRTFADENGLRTHRDAVHPEWSICPLCYKMLYTLSGRNHHMQHVHPPPILCVACGKQFKSLEARDQHCTDKHPPQYPCLTCGKIFSSLQARAQHVDVKHPVTHPCALCSKDFKSPEALEQHLRDKHSSHRSTDPLYDHKATLPATSVLPPTQTPNELPFSSLHPLMLPSPSTSSSVNQIPSLPLPATMELQVYRDEHLEVYRNQGSEAYGSHILEDSDDEDESDRPVSEGERRLLEMLDEYGLGNRTALSAYSQSTNVSESSVKRMDACEEAVEDDEDCGALAFSALEPSAQSMRVMSEYGDDVREDINELRRTTAREARVAFIDVDDQSSESDSMSAAGDYLDQSFTKASTIASNRCTVGDNLQLSILNDADTNTQNHVRSLSNSPVPQHCEEMRSSAHSEGTRASVSPQHHSGDADQPSSPTPSEYGSVRDLSNLDSDTRSETDSDVRSCSPAGQRESASAHVGVDVSANTSAIPETVPSSPGPVSGPPHRWMSASPAPDSPCSGSFDNFSRPSSPSSSLSSSSIVLITAEELPLYSRENRPYLVASSGPDGPRSESSTPLLLSPVPSSIDLPPSHIGRPLVRPIVDDRTETCSDTGSTSMIGTAPAAGSRLGVHCRVCGRDPCEDVTATMCGHLFCKRCITQEVMAHSACPVCKQAVLLYCLFPIDLAA